MRGLVQRVTRAEVRSRVSSDEAWQTSGSIGAGLCVLVGVTHDDRVASADKLASKIWGLRILDDTDGVMNRSLSDVPADGAAEVLVVSQFTLYGDARKGRRPSWIDAARPEHAEPLVNHVVDALRSMGATVATGVFRTEMEVDLTNDGPVTLMLEV
jgi:D-tyrosyl-tRNA(Tyr) deacylase